MSETVRETRNPDFDADVLLDLWRTGMEADALAALRECDDDTAMAFLERLAAYQRCERPGEHVAVRLTARNGRAPAHVYVVTANDDERVAEQKVFANYNDARREYLRLVDLYGGSAVCLASRYVRGAHANEVPA